MEPDKAERSQEEVAEVTSLAAACSLADQAGIVRRDVQLPDGNTKLAFVLENVFSKEECKEYIRKTEIMGYEKALVNIGYGRQQMMLDIRNNDRCIWDSLHEADKMWKRIQSFIPEYFEGHKVIALNERLRFLRYVPGQFFAPHYDGSYIRETGERSYITVQFYLNEGFEGGATTFLSGKSDNYAAVVPKTGSMLIFQHDILHEGSKLMKGKKYAVRTDIMYTKQSYPGEEDCTLHG